MKAQAESRQTLVLGVYAREFPGGLLVEFIFKVTQISKIHNILVMVAKEKTN